jgi:hypothetical protein
MGERPAVTDGQNAGYIASSGEITALRNSVNLVAKLNKIQDVHLFVTYVLTMIALLNEMSV